MKRFRKLVAVCALLGSVAIYGAARAATEPNGPPSHEHKAWHHHMKGGPMMVPRFVMKNIMLQALAQQTGKPADTLKQEIMSKGFRAVMEEYKVDRKALHSAIRTKSEALIKLLADNGYLTQEQSKQEMDHMEKQEKRHELLNQLIEKGIKDHTITPEQAKLLRPEHP
jgi:Spy/CpxP family protein refolding chaperone